MGLQSKNMIDVWLNNKGYYRKHIPTDDSCLFRIVSDQVFKTQSYHLHVRKNFIEFANQNRSQFEQNLIENWSVYIDKLQKHLLICGEVEMRILSKLYKLDFIVFDESTSGLSERNVTNNYTEKIMLCKIDPNHYDSVFKKDYADNLGFCQSVLYKLLYENVMEFDNTEQMMRSMLYEESDQVDVGEHLPPFPYKVAKALDPEQYRNVEYDAWNQTKRDTRTRDWYMGDDNFKIGTKCIWTVEKSKELICYIQEMKHDFCMVYVVETAERHEVKLSDLKRMPDAKPWPLRPSRTANKSTHENKFSKSNKKCKSSKKQSVINETTAVVKKKNFNTHSIDFVQNSSVSFNNNINNNTKIASEEVCVQSTTEIETQMQSWSEEQNFLPKSNMSLEDPSAVDEDISAQYSGQNYRPEPDTSTPPFVVSDLCYQNTNPQFYIGQYNMTQQYFDSKFMFYAQVKETFNVQSFPIDHQYPVPNNYQESVPIMYPYYVQNSATFQPEMELTLPYSVPYYYLPLPYFAPVPNQYNENLVPYNC